MCALRRKPPSVDNFSHTEIPSPAATLGQFARSV